MNHPCQLLGFAEGGQCSLGLRVDFNHPSTRFSDAEGRLVDPEANHGLDEGQILLERGLVDLQPVGDQLLAETNRLDARLPLTDIKGRDVSIVAVDLYDNASAAAKIFR